MAPFSVTSNPNVVVKAIQDFARDKALSLIVEAFHILTGPPEEGGTPRKTGFASSQWLPSSGAPATGVVGSKQQVDTQTQQAMLAALRASYKGGNLFLTNNASYLPELNNGSSAQAPSGFVQAAVAQALLRALR